MAVRKRSFGRLRKLPSGRYQARYLAPDGIDRPAPHTFRAQREADDWLAEKQAELRVGDWTDPDAANVPFGPYAATWITERGISASTADLYRSLLRNHLAPTVVAELHSGKQMLKEPKSAVGKRIVAIPDLVTHLAIYAEAGPDGRVFIGAKKATPRRPLR
nr:hypothetical protein OG781_18675 [Streptomyces sp. NBC_00830]